MTGVQKAVIGCVAILVALTGPAGAEGLPDILGIQIGMPVRDAYAKLQAELPKDKIEVQSTKFPTIDKPVIASFAASPKETIAIGMEADNVVVDATLPPNRQAVWRVSRTHFFPGKGIPRATLLASLREKYGKETRALDIRGKATADDNQIQALLWLMDEQGRPAKPPPLSSSGVDPITSCPRRADSQNIVESPLPTYGNKDIEWCLSSYTAVNVEMSQNAAMPELYNQMSVMAVSLPFAARAGQATMKWKQEIAEGAHKEDLEKANQQEKPKL